VSLRSPVFSVIADFALAHPLASNPCSASLLPSAKRPLGARDAAHPDNRIGRTDHFCELVLENR